MIVPVLSSGPLPPTMAKRLRIIDFLSVFLVLTSSVTDSFHLPSSTGWIKYKNEICERREVTQANHRHRLFAENDHHPYSEMESSLGRLLQTTDFGSSTEMSYYTPPKGIEEGAAATKQALQENAEKMFSYSDEIKSGVGDVGDQVQATATYQTLLRSSESISDFSKYYVSSLESKYHLSEFFESMLSGKSLEDTLSAVALAAHNLGDSMDLKHNASFMLLIASVFWGSDQRRAGLERGRKIGEEQIENLEMELRSARTTASGKSGVDSNEVDDLRQKMVRSIVFLFCQFPLCR